MTASITSLYAGILALLIICLIVPIVKNRTSLEVGLGDGGQRKLLQVIRAHGNAVEFIPIFLILLFLFEINGGAKLWLHIAGSVFVVARVLHAIGLYKSAGVSIWRVAGTMLSITPIVLLAVLSIWTGVRNLQ